MAVAAPAWFRASTPQQMTFEGTVTAAQAAVSGGRVQVHVLVPSGVDSSAAATNQSATYTDTTGSFEIAGTIACPSADSIVYLESTGGAVEANGQNNSSISLIAVLGPCGQLSSSKGLIINEVTTVGSLWPLASYISPATASASGQTLAQAVATAQKLVDFSNGSAPGVLAPGEFAPLEKINTLAGIFADCMKSAGGSPGDGSPCGELFSAVDAQNSTPPHDTLTAALMIARNPTWNVGAIFNLPRSPETTQPILPAAPSDWTLPIVTQPAAPNFSPNGGSLTNGQTIAIMDATPNASIYYTLDGSLPSTNSSRYSGPITISSSTTVTAVAITESVQSSYASKAFSVALPIAVALTPSGVTLGPSQSQLFQATVSGTSQTAVTYSISPAIGSISSAGLYTAPANPTTANTVTVTSRLVAASGQSAQAQVNVIPGALNISTASSSLTAPATQVATVTLNYPAAPGGTVVSLTSSDPTTAAVSPASVTLSAGQTQASFTVTGEKYGKATLSATAPGYTSANTTLSVNAPAIPRQFMGLNVGDTVNRWPTFQFGTMMTTGRVQWAATNPALGVYDFSILDQYFQFAQHYGADIIFPLLDTPLWASSNPSAPGQDGAGTCAPPTDMAYWDSYVRAVATHAGTSIKYWTVGNEVQDPGYWCGDVPTLVTMVQHARTIIRSINPNAVILAPSTNGEPQGPNMLAKFLAAGGGQYVDAISFHGYRDATAEDVLLVIAAYKQVLANANVNLPLWDTEADWRGYGTDSIADPAAQGAFVSKYFLLQWSQGIARFVWYAYDGGPWGGLVVSGGAYPETLAATAYAETYKWLVGASMNNPCTQGSDGSYSCGLVRANGYNATVMWNSVQNTQITIPAGSGFYRDLTGAEYKVTPGAAFTLGNQPVLFESSTLPN